MTNPILKAKSWQIFIVMFGPLLFVHLFYFNTTRVILTENDIKNSGKIIMEFTRFLIPVMIYFSIMFFTWLLSAGIRLQKMVPSHLQMKKGLFIFTNLFAIFHIMVFCFWFGSLISSGDNSHFENLIPYLVLFLVLHFIAIACIIYSAYFVSRTIRLAELKRKLKSDEFIGEFLFICFLLVGIWFLQPRINKLIKQEQSDKVDWKLSQN